MMASSPQFHPKINISEYLLAQVDACWTNKGQSRCQELMVLLQTILYLRVGKIRYHKVVYQPAKRRKRKSWQRTQ
jgi:hypothetical protein